MRSIEAFFLREWNRASAWQILLRPFAILFLLLVSIRRWCFVRGWREPRRLSRPVIVIGNITVGGTGKTPLLAALAAHFRQGGRATAIITRGSGGRERREVRLVGASSAYESDNALGDEARMLARRTLMPVYASVDRVAAGARAVHDNPKAAAVLSDDGLQHYRLARDIEVAVIDGIRGVGNGQMLPAGPLREPLSRLQYVDCIVVNTTAGTTPHSWGTTLTGDWRKTLQATTAHSRPPIFEMHYGNERFVSVGTGKDLDLADVIELSSRQRVVAVAGIGFPARFFAHLASLGVQLHATRALPDHYAFQAVDFRDVKADIILMTEKDAVKCQGFADERFIEMRVDAILPDAFYQFIDSRISACDVNGHRSQTA